MKIKKVEPDIVWGEYLEDTPPGPPGTPKYKKGDRFFRVVDGYPEFIQYFAHFISEAGILEMPRNASRLIKEDLIISKYLIYVYWKLFEEDSLKKVIARAKSKKHSIALSVIELLGEKIDYKKVIQALLKDMGYESKNTDTKTPGSGSIG